MPREAARIGQPDPDRLCIHTITTKPWPLEIAVEQYRREGVRGVTVWHDVLEGRTPAEAGRRIRDAGLEIVSLCRGGFFPGSTERDRRTAVENNLRLVDEAQELGAPLVVLVCGAVPGVPLEDARRQIRDGIDAVLAHAEGAGIRLGVEPLHPMYADSRSAVNTLAQANALCAELDHPSLGVVIDVYHLWWDPDLQRQIELAGESIFAFHISDWKTPTEDLLLDRGLMGEGCIPIRRIREWVEATGFHGYNEVEIFSRRRWEKDQMEFLRGIMQAYSLYS